MKKVDLQEASKLALIDSDTLLYQAANQAQENRYRFTDDPSQVFTGKTEAYAWAKDKGIEKDYIKDRLELFPYEVGEPSFAFHTLKQSIDKILEQPWLKDYRLLIGGGGNFRDDVATIWKYKGQRPAKPVLLAQTKDYMRRKYKGRVIEAFDEEADDVIAKMGWKWYRYAKEQGDPNASEVVLCYVDKDIDIVPGFRWNYLKGGDVYWQNNVDGFRCFCLQILKGDKQVDNIPGLTRYSHSTAEHFGTRKSTGCGPKIAEKLLEDCTTVPEMMQRVIDVYKFEYGEEPFELDTWKFGPKMVTWDYILNENALLLWMRANEGEMYCFTAKALEMGCEL